MSFITCCEYGFSEICHSPPIFSGRRTEHQPTYFSRWQLSFNKEGVMKTLPVMILLIATFCLSACNTLQGFGKDLQRSGEVIEKTAK